MKLTGVVIEGDGRRHKLEGTLRDWCLLNGPFFEVGSNFSQVLGLFENFTVLTGIPKGSFVTRNTYVLRELAASLHRAVVRDEELLGYDYSYSFSTQPRQRNSGGQSGIRIRGLRGAISTRPHGYCILELMQIVGPGSARVVEMIDMRVRGAIETEELGTLTIHRRRAALSWTESLPPLIEFLSGIQSPEVRIERCPKGFEKMP